MKAGAFVDKGTSGCVFKKPPLPCKGEEHRRSDTLISKLMESSEADEEIESTKEFFKIDPTSKYFLANVSKCTVDEERIVPEDMLRLCTIDDGREQRAVKDATLLFYEDGGTSLHTLHLQSKDYIPFFESFTNIVDGLVLAHSRKTYHLDIKPANIVAKKVGDVFHTRWIDFGLSVKEPKPSQEKVYDSLYIFWPLEMPLIGKLKSLTPQWYSIWLQQFEEHEFRTGSILRTVYWTHDNKRRYVFLQIQAMFAHSDFMDVEQAFACVDIFMLGVTLSTLILQFLAHTIVERSPGHLTIKVTRGGMRYFVEDLPESDFRSWHIEVAANISLPLYDLCAKMVDIDPLKRPDASEVLREYRNVLPHVQRLLKAEQVFTYLSDAGINGLDNPANTIVHAMGRQRRFTTQRKRLRKKQSFRKRKSFFGL